MVKQFKMKKQKIVITLRISNTETNTETNRIYSILIYTPFSCILCYGPLSILHLFGQAFQTLFEGRAFGMGIQGSGVDHPAMH